MARGLTITLLLADMADLAFGNGKNLVGQFSLSVPPGRLAAAASKLQQAQPKDPNEEKIWKQSSGFAGGVSLAQRLGRVGEDAQVGLVGKVFDPENPFTDSKKEEVRQWVLATLGQSAPKLGLTHLTQKTIEGSAVATILKTVEGLSPLVERFDGLPSSDSSDPLQGNDHWILMGQTTILSTKKWDLAALADPIFQSLRACSAAPDAYWGPFWLKMTAAEMRDLWSAPSRWQALSEQWVAAPRF